jgi:hypothetical protein
MTALTMILVTFAGGILGGAVALYVGWHSAPIDPEWAEEPVVPARVPRRHLAVYDGAQEMYDWNADAELAQLMRDRDRAA